MLGDPLLAVLQEMWMNPIVFPESPALKALREMLEARAEARGKTLGKTEGKALGKAEALLTFLTARQLPVDAATRARIEVCTDPLVLDRWIARAATAATLDEVFADGSDAE